MKHLPCKATIGDLYRPAMEVADQAEADAYFEQLVERSMRCEGRSRADAERLERSNLGYFAGYYDADTMARVNRLYATQHPIFGSGPPARSEQSLAAGQLIAAATSKGVAMPTEAAQAAVRTLLERDG
jgi:hypothetical protein